MLILTLFISLYFDSYLGPMDVKYLYLKHQIIIFCFIASLWHILLSDAI
jgi:hypothetical protein